MRWTVLSAMPRPNCSSGRSASSTMRSSRPMSARATSRTLHDYPVQLDRYDEAVEPSGESRPAWRTLSRTIARMSTAELLDRQRQADRLVEAEGASYLFHDGGTDSSRPWRLDPVPLVFGGTEWAGVERGVQQRVRIVD